MGNIWIEREKGPRHFSIVEVEALHIWNGQRINLEIKHLYSILENLRKEISNLTRSNDVTDTNTPESDADRQHIRLWKCAECSCWWANEIGQCRWTWSPHKRRIALLSAEQKSLDGGCLTKCHRSSQHAPLDWLVAISGPRACLSTLYWAIFTTRTSAKTIVTRAASSKRLKILSTCLLLIPPSAKQILPDGGP